LPTSRSHSAGSESDDVTLGSRHMLNQLAVLGWDVVGRRHDDRR
jgi:hypothetical protein